MPQERLYKGDDLTKIIRFVKNPDLKFLDTETAQNEPRLPLDLTSIWNLDLCGLYCVWDPVNFRVLGFVYKKQYDEARFLISIREDS